MTRIESYQVTYTAQTQIQEGRVNIGVYTLSTRISLKVSSGDKFRVWGKALTHTALSAASFPLAPKQKISLVSKVKKKKKKKKKKIEQKLWICHSPSAESSDHRLLQIPYQ